MILKHKPDICSYFQRDICKGETDPWRSKKTVQKAILPKSRGQKDLMDNLLILNSSDAFAYNG